MNALRFGSDSISDLSKPDFVGFSYEKFVLDAFA